MSTAQSRDYYWWGIWVEAMEERRCPTSGGHRASGGVVKYIYIVSVWCMSGVYPMGRASMCASRDVRALLYMRTSMIASMSVRCADVMSVVRDTFSRTTLQYSRYRWSSDSGDRDSGDRTSVSVPTELSTCILTYLQN